MSEHETQLETLEEKFARLREEGLSNKEILKAVFEENLSADIDELVRITGMKRLDIGRIKGSVSRSLKSRAAKKKAKAPPEPPTPYKTELDATAILREILEKHPDISPRVVNEVCSWAEYGAIHPTQLVYLLQSMRGIQSTTANIVAQKYSLALQKAQQEGRVHIPPPMYSPQLQQPQWGGPFPMPFQQPQPQMFPYQMQLGRPPSRPIAQPSQFAPQPSLYPPYWQPPQDVRSVVKEQIDDMKKYVDVKFETLRPGEERYVEIREPLRTPKGRVIVDDEGKPIVRTVKTPVSQYPLGQPPQDVGSVVKREIDDMKKYVDTKLETLRPREEYVEIREPLRTPEGKVIVDGEGNAVTRTVRAPVSQASQIALGGDPELRFLEKMKHYKDMFGKEELTAEKVRSIIQEERERGKPPSVEELPAVKELKEKLEENKKAYENLKERIDAEERKRLEDIIMGLRSKIDALATRPSGEYKADEYRLLAEGLNNLATVLKEKKPAETVREILAPPGMSSTRPPSEKAGAEERSGVLQQLAKEGLAVKVLERRR